MKALCIGVHVLDVLVRPVEAIPDGDGALVEEIRLTAAGSAGGTALVLARLGAEVRGAGAVGTDAAGDMLLALLEHEGIDTSLLLRRGDAPTSASVLPISPSGFTGAADVAEGSRALLDRGARCVIATLGGDGVLIDGTDAVPALDVEVVDTTGCGDAFAAGFLRGLSLGRDRRGAAELGCAAAALVAQGLGTDAGDYDLAAAEALA